MSIRASTCQTLGEDSQNSLYWKRNFPKDTRGPGRDWQKFKRLPDQMMYGQKYGRKLGKPLRIEKKDWAEEKPKLDNARKLWGIYFTDPDDKEYPEIIKNVRRKLERPMATSHCPVRGWTNSILASWKRMQSWRLVMEKSFKTVYGCMESHEST